MMRFKGGQAVRKCMLCITLMTFQALAVAAEYGTTDHQGADFTAADGDVLWGEHTNVGRFVVPAGVTAKVKAMDRETSTSPKLYGWLEVRAREIEVAGTLDASGSGYTGGGGGAGAGPDTAPGEGDYDDSFRRFFGGGGSFYHPVTNLYYAGDGGTGDGRWRGMGGDKESNGGDGGYAADGTNGDSSIDSRVEIGSGGGGGGGLWGSQSYLRTQPSGGGGGRGGGSVSLVAGERLTVSGRIAANGMMGQNAYARSGSGGRQSSHGGNSSPAEKGLRFPAEAEFSYETSGFGGAGAGGGILLQAHDVTVTSSARISNTGGGDRTTNAGTVKIIAENQELPEGGLQVQTGRLYVAKPQPASYPAADHGGADLVLGNSDIIWGRHTNVGRFVVPSTFVIRVQPTGDGPLTPEELEGLTVEAREIEILGSLNVTDRYCASGTAIRLRASQIFTGQGSIIPGYTMVIIVSPEVRLASGFFPRGAGLFIYSNRMTSWSGTDCLLPTGVMSIFPYPTAEGWRLE